MRKIGLAIEKIWMSPWLKVILLACVIFLIMLNLWGLSLVPGRVDFNSFGTVGDWFSGLATVSTVIVAALAIRNDRLSAQREREHSDRIRQEDLRISASTRMEARRLEAEAVFAWSVPIIDNLAQRRIGWKLNVANMSGAPIYEWRVCHMNGDDIADSKSQGPILPGANTFEVVRDLAAAMPIPESSELQFQFRGFIGEVYIRRGEVVEVSDGI